MNVASKSSDSVCGRSAQSGALLDRLVHDLKQPLNHIRVVAQDVRLDVCKNRLEIETVPESMYEIEQAVGQLAIMLDRLHRFAPEGTSESKLRVVDVASMCELAIARVRESSEGVSITHTSTANLFVATQDPAGLEQALWEILDNAARAARQGGAEKASVEVSTFARGGFVVVTIRDNGSGVPADDREAIFTPFFSNQEKTSGLGLSLARAIIVQAGGHVELVDSSEHGSSFEVAFPTCGEVTVGGS